MLRNIFSKDVVGACVVFFVLVGGVQFYGWHVRRSADREFGEPDRSLRHLEKGEARHAREADPIPVADMAAPSFEVLPEERPAVPMSAETDTERDESNRLNSEETLLPDAPVSDGETVVDAPYGMSPYGFGPFPAIPPGYPDQGIWSAVSLQTMQPNHELLVRVEIELWNQGIRTLGAVFDNRYQLVFPILDDVVYYEEHFGPNGSVTRRRLTSPATDDKYGEDMREGIFAPHLTVYYFPDGGIDPYHFLGLPR